MNVAILFHCSFFSKIPFERKKTKPIICSIDGWCTSLGFELALMCDIRIVDETAVFGFTNRKFGMPSVNGGPSRLTQLIGLSRSLDLTISGREISAKEAVEIGLAKTVVEKGTCNHTYIQK